MTRYWAVLLIAATLCSCRTAQPTNPFLRTTVPPPATGGVVVTPGTPYAQGISPPMVTTPAPAITPAPITTQPVPVTPAPVGPAAPIAAPPSVAPQGDQFKAPGGSYLFHQSSNQPQPAQPLAAQSSVQFAAATPPAAPRSAGKVTQATYIEPAPVKVSRSTQPAGIIENPYVKNPAPAAVPATLPAALPAAQPAPLQPAVARMTLGDSSRGDPPDTSALAIGTSAAGNTLRIIGQSSSNSLSASTVSPTPPAVTFTPAAAQPQSDTVLRITAGAPQASLVSSVPHAAGSPAQSTLTVGGPSGNTATLVADPAAQPVVQAAFQPAQSSAGGADYAHSADYSALRGRLEYSPAQRQWKLRYIPIDGTTDNFGGSVVLPESDALRGFQPGDMVTVRGSLGESSAAAGYAPRYLPASIQRTR